MHGLLPTTVLLLVNFIPISIGAPIAIPVPTAQSSSSFPDVADGSLPIEAREPLKTDAVVAKARPALGQPTDYAHVDLQGMIGDLVLPQQIKPSVNPNSNSTAISTATSTTTTTSTA